MASACDGCAKAGECTSKENCEKVNGIRKLPVNNSSDIKCVIGIASGKGGVGKSFVTSVLAHKLASSGLKVGIMDADITGPSIPRAFGLREMLMANDDNKILPAVTEGGIKAVSLNLLMEDENAPVIWRGPVLSGLVQQFWSDVEWGTLDVLLIDMPPGTGDIPLTIFQSLPLNGLVLISTPQELVSMIVSKARNMASMMNVNILGVVENMSYVICPHCGEKLSLFGDDEALVKASSEAGITILDKLPLDPSVTALVDSGKAEQVDVASILGGAAEAIGKLI
ncbi:MAG: Mrp/NBP35 family ATP-binding protein [Clostridiales bacterium]|nr:Mrp/NBP35 family ATP-binding protein [Clostridiales bacterium]